MFDVCLGRGDVEPPPDNIFARIARKEEPAEVVFEDDQFIAFREKSSPASTLHLLIVPKVGAVRDATCLSTKHLDMLEAMVQIGRRLIREEAGLTENQQRSQASMGFHIPPVVSIPHLHMHCIAPCIQMSVWSKIMYWKDSPWFVQANTLIRRLRDKQNGLVTI